MKDNQKNKKKDFIKLIMLSAEMDSQDNGHSRDYLSSEGLNPDEIVSRGIEMIKNFQANSEKDFNQNIVSENRKVIERTWKNISVATLLSSSNYDNPITAIKEKARELVLKGFNYGWSGPPYSPIELAKLLAMDISPNEELPDARIIPVNSDNFRIEYNPFQRESRINFSIAHEIAHTLFPDCNLQIRNREENRGLDEWELEYLCDIAAAEILLPYATFAEEANSALLNLSSILEISNKYKASLESVFLRFCEVVDKPCAMAIAYFEDEEQKKLNLDYFKASRTLSLNLPSNYTIPSDSKAYECLNSGWTSQGIEQWDIFSNTRYNVFGIGLPPLKKQRKQRVGLFIVPEYYNNTIESPIYKVSGDATMPRGGGVKIIVQPLNTTGGVGFGFGRAMSTKWPESKKNIARWKESSNFVLGATDLLMLNQDTYAFQIIAQQGLFTDKKGQIPLRYEILKDCLRELAQLALELDASIHMPMIGAGQGKGDWGIIEGIIHDELVSHNLNITIYQWGEKPQKKDNNLTLFD